MNAYRPWRVVHLRLDEAVPDLAHDPAQEGVYAIFWWRGLPLGASWIPAVELPMCSDELSERGLATAAAAVTRNLDWHLGRAAMSAGAGPPAWKVEQPLAMLRQLVDARCREAGALGASVIVCTRDRAQLLGRCLDSLAGVLGPHDEVVVVDNAPSSDATRRVVLARPAIRYVNEPRPGLDVARNRGVRESLGEVVVFCDDDVTVEPGWLQRLKAAFLDPAVAAVTGLVLPASLDTEAEFVFERYWSFGRGFALRTFGSDYFAAHRSTGVPVWEIGAGASMGFRRRVLAEVGGFDERLDAGAAGCSGDSEMWYRILAAGHECLYEPTAVSHHQHRRGMPELEHQLFSYMRGHSTALLIQFEHHRHWGNLRRLLWSLPAFYAGKFARHVAGTERRRTQTLGKEIAGWLAGVGYYLRQERRAPPIVVGGAGSGGDLR